MLRGEDSTKADDVYSFGVVAWELATCRWPFGEMKPLQVAHEIAYRGLKPTWTHHAPREEGGGRREGGRDPREEGCPQRWLAALCKRCWADEPDERPAFAEVVRVLGEASDSNHESQRTCA